MLDETKPSIQVIKIGGSIITFKDKVCDFNESGTMCVGKSLADFKGPLIIIHGTGSFGKPPARDYNYMNGFLGTDKKEVVAKVENMLRLLRLKVLETLMKSGLPVFGVHVRELFYSNGSDVHLSQTRPVTDLLRRGLIPVISGGFIIDRTGGFYVCSSDIIATELAKSFHAQRLIFATDQPGVYSMTSNSDLLAEFHPGNLDNIAAAQDDVSKGMKGKLDAAISAANAGLHTIITDGRNPENILDLLNGKPGKGTRIIGNGSAR